MLLYWYQNTHCVFFLAFYLKERLIELLLELLPELNLNIPEIMFAKAWRL